MFFFVCLCVFNEYGPIEKRTHTKRSAPNKNHIVKGQGFDICAGVVGGGAVAAVGCGVHIYGVSKDFARNSFDPFSISLVNIYQRNAFFRI